MASSPSPVIATTVVPIMAASPSTMAEPTTLKGNTGCANATVSGRAASRASTLSRATILVLIIRPSLNRYALAGGPEARHSVDGSRPGVAGTAFPVVPGNCFR